MIMMCIGAQQDTRPLTTMNRLVTHFRKASQPSRIKTGVLAAGTGLGFAYGLHDAMKHGRKAAWRPFSSAAIGFGGAAAGWYGWPLLVGLGLAAIVHETVGISRKIAQDMEREHQKHYPPYHWEPPSRRW